MPVLSFRHQKFETAAKYLVSYYCSVAVVKNENNINNSSDKQNKQLE